MKGVFPPEWRSQSRSKRHFYATYMRRLERIGFVVVLCVLAAFVFAFNYKVDDLITATGVKIEPVATLEKADQATVIIRTITPDFSEVRKGQPLLEVVEREDAVWEYMAWSRMMKREAEHPETLLAPSTYAPRKPVTRIVLASSDGTFRIDAKLIGVPLEPGAEMCRVVNYSDLRLTASLAGQTAPAGRVGQMALVTSIAVEPDAGTLFRVSPGGDPLVSGKLLGDGVRASLQKELVGKTVHLRDDVPLSISEIKDIQIDANGSKDSSGDATHALALDPPAGLSIQAKIVEGKPTATAQVALLSSDLGSDANEAVRKAVKGRTVRQYDGSVTTLKDVSNVQTVVTVKANQLAADGSGAIDGAVVTRTFDVTLQIVDPPAALVQTIRDADRAGKSVTARVEARTGTRPIAFLLLKKS